MSLGTPFPKNFMPISKKILTRLFRVFVHVYIHHFDKLQMIGAVSAATSNINMLLIGSCTKELSPAVVWRFARAHTICCWHTGSTGPDLA